MATANRLLSAALMAAAAAAGDAANRAKLQADGVLSVAIRLMKQLQPKVRLPALQCYCYSGLSSGRIELAP